MIMTMLIQCVFFFIFNANLINCVWFFQLIKPGLQATNNISEDDKWEDAVGTPHDLISVSSTNNYNTNNNNNNNNNSRTKSPSVLQQQQQYGGNGSSKLKLNSSLNSEQEKHFNNELAALASSTNTAAPNYKYINHSMSDDVLNYDAQLAKSGSTAAALKDTVLTVTATASRYSPVSHSFNQLARSSRYFFLRYGMACCSGLWWKLFCIDF